MTHRPSAGFSILEMLVALAILSLTSLILFQTVLSQAALTSRIENASLRSGQELIRRSSFKTVVSGLVPTWPEEEADIEFAASPELLRGMSTSNLTGGVSGLHRVTFRLEGNPSRLIYSGPEGEIELQTFSELATFSYLGLDNNWYGTWPPDTAPDFGPFDDSGHPQYEIPPLPVAVRIRTVTGQDIDWLARLDWQAPRLARSQELNDF
ncbi:prepilin-type N-terminal cleavage/methylation domain-containing protein [Hyphomonas sp. FCG-A18]|uniref:PulJ/GspJ family protein n=1 Tax=Hyphomonas sp. FCG-A18 TaxID=3080019 RepID=UPI002B296BDF|nr:prepilin-type N-terminal cleavage/methylation domain-containing protein [Hyphomonas sp. FCG-A18]